MEKNFAALRLLDCDSECKLTRSSSFSDLKITCRAKKYLFTKPYQSGSCESLVKEYTWEKISDSNPNTRQIEFSKIVRNDNDEPRNLWKKTIPDIKIDLSDKQKKSTKKMNHDEQKMPEYMEVEEFQTDKPSSSLNQRKSSSLFCIKSALSTSPTAKISSTQFQASLSRSSRSDITNLLPSQKKESGIFNISKSFGQFTFENVQSNDSKENPCVRKSESPNQDSILKQKIEIKQLLEKGKKKLRPLMQEKKNKPMYRCSCWQIIFFLLLPVTVVLISTILDQQQIGSKFCDPSFNFTNVTKNLQKFVHGQTAAVSDLVEFLETDVFKFKIIALVGGTGVGKSHVSNIMKSSLSDNFYAFEYFPPIYNKVRQAYSELSTCRCNLIILENLGTEDISDAAFFSHALRNKASHLCVLILALFNTQVTDSNLRRSLDLQGSVANIENDFRKEGVEAKAIGFEPLLEDSIMKCIQEAITESHLKLSQEDITQIKKHLITANSGCKGAYSKVQLLGKNPAWTEN